VLEAEILKRETRIQPIFLLWLTRGKKEKNVSLVL
jgi:hypothetical protein